MEITGAIEEVRKQVKEWRRQGLSVGLVPTMGYLHEGHKSLIERAVAENDRVVVSDFVNPIQFGINEDLATYPRDIEADKRLCEQAGADLIFHPEAAEMYAPDFSTYVEMQKVSEGLCGKTRPTHFRGVCTVVCKLFHIVMPDRAYFGQKDAQQLAVIRRMVRDLDLDIQIVGCPIIREEDGLAKSSRNTYLSREERKAALVLSRAVFLGEDLMKKGERDADTILAAMRSLIEQEPLAKIDYVEMVDAEGNQVPPPTFTHDFYEEIKDDQLYRVVTGMYSAQMLGTVKGKSLGLLSLEPKMADGSPVDDFEACILRDENGNEIKEWYALAAYLQTFGEEGVPSRYARPDGRKDVSRSWNPIELVKSPSWITLAELAVLIAAAALAVFLVRWVHYARKRRRYGKGTRW